MAEIEIEGADKHALEHQAEHGDNLTIRIAVITVMLAIVATVFNHFGEEMADESAELKTSALLVKGESGEHRTKAGNQWAYFQSKSTKQSLAENVIAITTDAGIKEKYQAKVDRYEKEKAEIQAEAKSLDATADILDEKVAALDEQSEEVKKPEGRLKLALPMLQVAIALASITALTRVKWMLWIAVLFATVGIGFALSAIYQSQHLPDHVLEWEKKHGGNLPAAAHGTPAATPEAHAAK